MGTKLPREIPILDLKIFRDRVWLQIKKPLRRYVKIQVCIALVTLIVLVAALNPEVREFALQLLVAILEAMIGAVFSGFGTPRAN
jgi:hypothetical protein